MPPDVNAADPEAEPRFRECAEAWEVLSDPGKRAAYDRHGFAGLRGRPMTDFQSVAFRDLYNAYFGTDDFGVPMHPFLAHQALLREYLKQRAATAKTSEGEAKVVLPTLANTDCDCELAEGNLGPASATHTGCAATVCGPRRWALCIDRQVVLAT